MAQPSYISIPVEELPFKTESAGSRISFVEAFKRDVDFWGNGRRKIFHHVTPSLVQFLNESNILRSGCGVEWCDVGCGGGFFLEGLISSAQQRGFVVDPRGVDVSPEALDRCRELWPGRCFEVMDLNNLAQYASEWKPWFTANVVSIVDVLHYLNNYKMVLDRIWTEIPLGTTVVVADSVIRFQFRRYLDSKPDAALIGSWTDRTMPVVEKIWTGNGTNRYMKYVVYRKLS